VSRNKKPAKRQQTKRTVQLMLDAKTPLELRENILRTSSKLMEFAIGLPELDGNPYAIITALAAAAGHIGVMGRANRDKAKHALTEIFALCWDDGTDAVEEMDQEAASGAKAEEPAEGAEPAPGDPTEAEVAHASGEIKALAMRLKAVIDQIPEDSPERTAIIFGALGTTLGAYASLTEEPIMAIDEATELAEEVATFEEKRRSPGDAIGETAGNA
jgi:hypothetical protein